VQTPKITVLLIEDSPADEERVRRLLARSDHEFEIWPAHNWRGAAEVLTWKRVDLVLSDYDLPGYDGLTILDRLNSLNNSPPVIFLTGSGNEEVAAEAFRNGALDYLRKDRLTTDGLVKAIIRALEKKALDEQQIVRTELLERLASTDPLTGMSNRRSLEERVESELSLARSENYSVSCLMIDIDNLKYCNETFGHQAGDSLIQGVAAAIRIACHNAGIATRYGGDEFCLILPRADDQVASSTATRILEAVRHQSLPEDPRFSIEVSIGAYTAMPNEALTAVELIARADRHLGRAKQQGKNALVTDSSPVRLASPDLPEVPTSVG
jgi:diguanylate cyclase (GGDEF)-like protein